MKHMGWTPTVHDGQTLDAMHEDGRSMIGSAAERLGITPMALAFLFCLELNRSIDAFLDMPDEELRRKASASYAQALAELGINDS